MEWFDKKKQNIHVVTVIDLYLYIYIYRYTKYLIIEFQTT